MVIGSIFINKSASDPLRPLYNLLDQVGASIQMNDCLETRMNVEIAALEIASNLYEWSDSSAFEVAIDIDVDGIDIIFCDWTSKCFKPKVFSPEKAEVRLKGIDVASRGRGLLLAMAVSNRITWVDNSTTIQINWKTAYRGIT